MNLFKRCGCPDSKCRHSFWFRFRMHGREHRSTTRTANRNLANRIAHRHYNDALDGNPHTTAQQNQTVGARPDLR